MKLSEVKQAAEVCFASKSATPCLVGVSGSGKTSIWGQIAPELGFDRVEILRPALLADAADLIGLPDFEIIEKGGKAVKTTAFMRPKWLPFEGEKVLIVIDEINRATKDVSNALFGLIEAEKPFIGEYVLPEGCKVVATCNPPTDNYAGVLDFADSAWSSRLCFIKIAPSLDVYTNYGRQSETVSNVMLDFLNKNETFFGTSGDFDTDMFFTDESDVKETNTRSFSKVSSIFESAKDLGTPRNITFELVKGIVGTEFATSFMNFADTYSNIVTVDDLLTDPEAYTRFDYTALSGIAKVLQDLKFKIGKGEVEEAQIPNILPFLKKIPLDTLKGFVVYLVKENKDDTNGALMNTFAETLIDDEELDEKLDLVMSEESTAELAETETEEENEDN